MVKNSKIVSLLFGSAVFFTVLYALGILNSRGAFFQEKFPFPPVAETLPYVIIALIAATVTLNVAKHKQYGYPLKVSDLKDGKYIVLRIDSADASRLFHIWPSDFTGNVKDTRLVSDWKEPHYLPVPGQKSDDGEFLLLLETEVIITKNSLGSNKMKWRVVRLIWTESGESKQTEFRYPI